jgi:6-phosphofructokinase 2
LRDGLAGGGIFLVKPSLGELRQLVGKEIDGTDAVAAAAMNIVHKGQAQLVAVTMGHQGAVLARQAGALLLPALAIEAKSAVGAGDSFLAAMVFALASGRDEVAAFRFGIAAGAAAVLTPGTDLARPDDIDRLYPLVAKG